MANIRTARRSGLILRGGVMRRETVWLFLPVSQLAIPAGGTSVLLNVFNAAALALRPFTVVRTRTVLSLRGDQLATAEIQVMGYGASIVTEQATAIGVTAVPTPITDLGSDQFFVHELLFNSFEFGSAIGFEAVGGRERIVDSKAMRKVKESDDLALTVETDAISDGVLLISGGRMLIKLH